MSDRPEPYRNEPMSRDRAYDVAIAFGLDTRLPCQPRPSGEGFDAVIPIELLEVLVRDSGYLPPRPR